VELCERLGLCSANAYNLNNLKDQQRVTAKTEEQNAWHKVEYYLEMCRERNRAYI
jgi:hypothetical protein